MLTARPVDGAFQLFGPLAVPFLSAATERHVPLPTTELEGFVTLWSCKEHLLKIFTGACEMRFRIVSVSTVDGLSAFQTACSEGEA